MRAISDVRRGRMLAVVAGGAALATAISIGAAPAPVESRPGALALPHEGLACNSCHEGSEPAKACLGCHGPHPSRRAGHRELIQSGEMGCPSCHDVHGDDGGVRLGDPILRYGVGRSVVVEGEPTPVSATIPLVPLARCTDGCHAFDGDDPIARCRLEPDGTVNLCFDEHRSALATGSSDGACRDQHGPRLGAWEGASRVAATSPPLPAKSSPAPWWLAWGVVGAATAGLGYGGVGLFAGRAERRRREREAEALAPRATTRRRLPVIDVGTCLGCYACVDACPYDVLRIERYVALVDRPEACCGLVLCEQSCPNGSLTMREGDVEPDHPRLGEDLEAADVPGLFLAGDITGIPLIKTAILQGRRAVDGARASLPKRHDAPLDLLIVGAGPAGISASLRAKELGLRARAIDQGSVAQSIRSFPRGKLIFDQPLELPLAGKLWLERSTKEELLAKWLRVVREEKLAIDEDRRFVSLEREGEAFVVEARDEGGRAYRYRSARVVLAIGTRGTARKLPIAIDPEVADKVFYSLADARSFAGMRVVIVGLGDVAMETACAIAAQPGSEVTVAYRGTEVRRGKEKNRLELERLVSLERVTLLLETEVEAIARERVELTVAGTKRTVENDAVFVMIGSLPPRGLLEHLGVGFGARDPGGASPAA